MAGIVATGGTITTDGLYTVHTFTSSGTFQVTSGSGNVWYLVIAGGGSGGGAANNLAGGGGAGGYLTNDAYDYAVTVGSYTVTVGAGGLPGTAGRNPGLPGADSVFDTITATGGGYGSSYLAGDGGLGGSGGGAPQAIGAPQNGGTRTASPVQGNDGGDYPGSVNLSAGAGGGGAGAAGTDCTVANTGSKGGDGLASTITGASVKRAAGGGGSGFTTRGAGGDGGGGQGAIYADNSCVAGTANTGSGGGAAGSAASVQGAAGGSGVVIVRYLTAVAPVADFSGTPLSGDATLSVAFTDLSTETPTSWAWTFGDAQTSTSQNPTNIYASAGTYTVGLTATNAAGSDLETKTDYITVTSSADTHDGFDDTEVRKHVKERVREEEKAFRSKRERLREVLEQAFAPEVGPEPVAAQVREVAAPYVERLESGAPRVDYARLEKNAAVMRQLLKFQNTLRTEYNARMAIEQDDEEVILLMAQ